MESIAKKLEIAKKELAQRTSVAERVKKGLCYICGQKAKHTTVVGSVYLCDDERCWIETCREEFIEGMNELSENEI